MKHLVARDEDGAVTMLTKCCARSAKAMLELHPELVEVDEATFAAARAEMIGASDDDHPQLVALRALAAQRNP